MPTLGRYVTLEELGRGGTSVVYRARDTATEREVAVKVLSSHLLHDPDLLARFEREIKLAVRLEHPHIVPLLDVGTEGQFPYIVMRLLGGGSLSDRIRQGPLSAAETVRVLQEVASALDEAHRQNIVHRDLKPSNILFDQRGTAYLADFGVARLMDSPDSLTASAGVVGTPAYMSPEQLKGQLVTGLADQYALGLVAFQALTARLPYEGTTAQMILQQLQEPLPSVRRYNAGLSPTFERVLARATAKDPGARYATASEFAAALATAAAEAPLPVIVASAQPSLATQEDIALITPPPMTRPPLPLAMAAAQPPASVAVTVAEPAPAVVQDVAQPLPVPSRQPAQRPQRRWIGGGLLVLVLSVLIGLGWQWLAAATPLPPAPTIMASATATEAALTPAPSATPEAPRTLITLDPDAIALAVVELPPGLAAASVHDVPQGIVIATVPDQSLVQILRGRETTPDDVVWVKVRLLTGEVGWMVESLLRYLTETTVEATIAASPAATATTGSAATGAVRTQPATQLPGPAASATRPPSQATQPPAPTTSDGGGGSVTVAAPTTRPPAATTAPAHTPPPPASSTAPAPTATTAPPTRTPVLPPTNTAVPPATNTAVPPATNTPVPPPTTILDPVPTLVCGLLPICGE